MISLPMDLKKQDGLDRARQALSHAAECFSREILE